MGRRILFIRHGKTKGNLEKRYVGKTDEGLCQEGIQELQEKFSIYSMAGLTAMPGAVIYASPLKRCMETAALLFPGSHIQAHPGLRECDFGEFEYKNYLELTGNKNYQSWIDSGGNSDFPGGEKTGNFKARCRKAYEEIILAAGNSPLVLVVHGGTIMSILEKYSKEQKGYYSWQIGCGEGYLCELTERFSLEVLEHLK